jgi:hypothetical protein
VDKISLAGFHCLDDRDGGFIAIERKNEAGRLALLGFLGVTGVKGVNVKTEIIANRFLIFWQFRLCL